MTDAAEKNGAEKKNGKANGSAATPTLTLPYADFSHALIRAHHDAFAMAAANRALADSLRGVLRRQQDLAFELAETALGTTRSGAVGPAAIFDRAAQAVRELGEAIIDAQLEALRLLQSEAETKPAADVKNGADVTPSAAASRG